MNFSEVGHISRSFDLHDVPQTDSQILSDRFVHADFSLFQLVIDQGNHQGLFALLSLNEDGVSLENFELVHLGLTELYGRVLISVGLFHLNKLSATISLLGAFFWSRIAVDTSFLTGSITNLK